MRPWILIAALACASCTEEGAVRLPPTGRLYFPTSLAHLVEDPEGTSLGTLYAASSNFDQRYGYGTLVGIDLDALGLPEIGAAPEGPPLEIEDLQITDAQSALIGSYAGELAVHPLAGGGHRLFLPTRGEGSRLNVIDVDGAQLTCAFPPGPEDEARDCGVNSPSLLENATGEDKPRAPAPIGVAVADGRVFVTHMSPADEPTGSLKEREHFLVQADAEDPAAPLQFTSIGLGGAFSLAVGPRFVFLTGAVPEQNVLPTLVRLVDRETDFAMNPAIEQLYRAGDARGLELTPDGSRGYLIARNPDALLTLEISNPTSPTPRVTVVRSVALPKGASQLRRIERPGRGDLIVISCTDARSVVFYDADLGALVAQIPDLGIQPFGLAVHARGEDARIYVSLFGEGQVAVLDVPDLGQPQEVRHVATLGASQACLLTDEGCPEESL